MVSLPMQIPANGNKEKGTMTITDRARGALLGLAVGDAVGTTLEFREPGSFEPIDDMIGGGPFGLEPGQWTDDTSMALCLADSLIENGFDPADQMRRYLRWRDEGYRSATHRCFDIGGTVDAALRRFQRSGDPFSGETGEEWSGNGAIMRLAPIPLSFHADLDAAQNAATAMSRTTHGSVMCQDAAHYMTTIVWRFILGQDTLPDTAEKRYCEQVQAIVDGDYARMNPPDIISTGFVIDTLRAALWAFHTSDNFRDGLLKAVNLGGDADTAGAVYGQIAGARYGADAIPAPWRQRVFLGNEIIAIADRLISRAT